MPLAWLRQRGLRVSAFEGRFCLCSHNISRHGIRYFLQLQFVQVQSGPHWQLSPQEQVVVSPFLTMQPQARAVLVAIVS
jgi:hypothetical protein